MSKVSVIIPIFNSEEYLQQCLDSVLEQSLTDIEIVCIDDCSTDSSKDIVSEYAKKDNRIKILYNDKNMGLSFSRNRAVEEAKGEYIQYLDSDDYLCDDKVLEALYSVSHENELDLLKSRIYSLKGQNLSEHILYPESVADCVFSGKELLYRLESHNTSLWNSTSNFVRREFVLEKGITFLEGIIHEDVLYSYDMYYYAERAMCVNRHSYVYVKRENSLTTQHKSINHLKGYLEGMYRIINRDFTDSSLEFRYATIKYILRMQKNAMKINMELGGINDPEILGDKLRRLYDVFLWNVKSLVDKDIIVQNLDKILQSERVYIYGAGEAAKSVIRILGENDILIDGVFVTDVSKSAKTILGHKVHGIDSLEPEDAEIVFLVAITRPILGNVLDMLHEKGYKNIIYVCF